MAKKTGSRIAHAPKSLALRKIGVLAGAALVGALITFFFNPFQLIATHFLSDHLSRARLSIEAVELVIVEPVIVVNPSKARALMSANGYHTYATANPSAMQWLALAANGSIPRSYKAQIELSLSQLADHIEARLIRIADAESSLQTVKNVAELRRVSQRYFANNYDPYLTTSDSVEELRPSFLSHLTNEKTSLTLFRQTAIELEASVADQSNASIKWKATILNRGNTDGLVRGEGFLRLNNGGATIPVFRTAAPKRVSNADSLFAVPVTVTNPTDQISDSSVGRVEKRTMVEFWFGIDEKRMTVDALSQTLLALQGEMPKKLMLTLFDQDRSAISREWETE